MANSADAWQRGLYRGDSIENFAFPFFWPGSAKGEPFPRLADLLHPCTGLFGKRHRTPLVEALMLSLIWRFFPKKILFPNKEERLKDYAESRLSSLLLSEIKI